MKVKVWEEEVWLPTYGIGNPDKNPMFFEKRVYQGSSGVVYPYPVIESISDHCEPKAYRAVYLENEYIKVMILPELGGRVQMAYDKIKERHFIYYNHVVKPALVGLTGPWISGGIEFNWPQHHRPSTFLPVDYQLEECEDGSAIVWVSERERMFHQKGMAGFTLRPGKAVLEIQGKVYNPTSVPQTFLWWANPAVAVNDAYQSVFPDDVHAVFDHGKRDVSRYPIATGVYYKMDYSAGVDISRYKNIPVPTSYMAVCSKYNFVGGYENDTRAGLLHVANHHISPGKKQWTWGNGDFGQAWDRNLTDQDGPYIELMTGVYTDNQPDFTWLQPYEEKTFTQYFMPYRELGVVKNASADLLMNLEPVSGRSAVELKLFATSVLKQLHVVVKSAGMVMFDEVLSIAPEEVYTAIIDQMTVEHAEVCVYRPNGRVLLSWTAPTDDVKPVPDAAKPALQPAEIRSTEQLYLTGLHLEQYRHATYDPTAYYQEALRRDATDVRNNNAMGLWLFRRGQFIKSEPYFRAAVKTLVERNPNPYDGEPYYNLGLSLKYQGRYDEAYDAFYKACWNAAWQDAGYYSLAQISVAKGEWEDALSEIDRSLVRNWHNHRARHLKTLILRKMGRVDEALELIQESLKIDAFNFGCRFEAALLEGKEQMSDEFRTMMRDESRNYEELAVDYAQAGCWEEALQVVRQALIHIRAPSPMLYYYQSWFLHEQGLLDEAKIAAQKAELQPQDEFFPNTLEAILALQCVTELMEKAPKAYYLLGNIWYDKRQYQEAVAAWEESKNQDDTFATVHRNLALAYYNKYDRKQEALNLLERAFALNQEDARVLMELDQLYKRMNYTPEERLRFLSEHLDVVAKRDDLYLEYATLLNLTGAYEQARDRIDRRKFHPWEGGEGKVPAQYQYARMKMAVQLMEQGACDDALHLINECFVYPENLGEGKLYGAYENDFFYIKGCILEKMQRKEEAKSCFEQAASGQGKPSAAMYYNDQKPYKIYYQGLALYKLGKEAEAHGKFNQLVAYGEKHLYDTFVMDYFAVSLPDLQIWEDDMNKKNRILCQYLMGLGYLGLGQTEKAHESLDYVMANDRSFQLFI